MGNIFAAHLKLVDAVANRDKFVGAPDEAVHLDGLDALLQLVHRRLVVPGLHVEQDGGLGDKSGLLRLLGGISLRRQRNIYYSTGSPIKLSDYYNECWVR